MNLLFVSSYADLGGGETALLNLAQHLDSARYLPHLLIPREGQLSQRWRESGWPVYVQPWRGASVYFVPALWAQLPVSRRIEAIIRENGIRAVHGEYHCLPMLLPAAERAGVPALWTCMGWWFRPRPWQRAFFRRATATFAHSEAIKRGFLGEPPFMHPDGVEVLYPGVDTQRFHPGVDGIKLRFDQNMTPETPLVVLIARFQEVKGHEVFLQMARQVALQIPDVRFLVAGENIQSHADLNLKNRMLTRAHSDPLLRKRLTYLGFQPDVEQVIGAADVVVCSSHFEGYGMVNIEAMACGKPVVSTNRGGPMETVLHGETGYLVPPGDAAALARYVTQLLRDPDLRSTIGQAGRARVEALFSGPANAAQFSRRLEAVLSIRGKQC